jgi:hypothetical protein
MGVTWVRGSAAGLKALPEKIVAEFRKKVEAAMVEVINQAVEDMRRYTESRPSAKSGKAGRIETGAMLESIAGKTFMEGADKVVGQFGFINRQELYFMLQTSTGFEHYGSGDFIEPTFAMRDAAVTAVQNLIQRLGDI